MEISITDSTWQLECSSKEQKQELFDYAAEYGITDRYFGDREPCRNDEDLFMEYWGSGLWSEPASDIRKARITIEQFKSMCAEYADTLKQGA